MAVMRTRRGTLFAKVEGTEGVDAVPTTANAMLIENPRVTFDPGLIQTNDLTGSLDPRAPIVGGLKAAIAFDLYMKGSGTAGTAPEFGDLFKACGWEEVVTSAAIPTTAEVAAAGGTSQLTLSTGATSAAQAYRGMPLLLAVNPATPKRTFITNYTAGKVATLTDLFAPPLSVTTEYQVPANVLYRPTSDDTLIKTLTLYSYMDGVLYKLFGVRGTFTLAMTAGGVGKLSFNMTGMYGGKSDAAVPSIQGFDTTRPPVWRDPNADTSGHFGIDRAEAALRQLSFDNGNTLVYPDNPNAAEGFDPSVIAARRMTGSMDPLATLVATRDLMANFRVGTQSLLHARCGTAAGNRYSILIPAAHPERYENADREGLVTDQVGFFCSGEDAGAFMCFD